MFKKQLLLFSILIIGFYSTAQKVLPTIDEVAQLFYETYDANELSYPQVGFEKRKNGWTVTTKKYTNNELINEQSYLYYDAVKSAYLKLPLKSRINDDTINYKSYVGDYQIRNYQLHQFYGYEGWYKDVIEDLSKAKKLSDSSLYSLARAYSTYASALLSLQTGEALKNDLFALQMEPNCISTIQLKLYDSLAYLAEQSFKRLVLQNAKFETVVGPITMKYANEVMVHFHTYLVYADKLAASFQLPENLYNDSVIAATKQLLQKCPTDAILLSLGDNDFYPVLYVQQKLGIRKDVYLINQSLLGLDRFIYRATLPQFNAKPIQLSFTKYFFEGNKNDYMPMTMNDSLMPFKNLIAIIQADKTNSDGIIKIPANNFSFEKRMGKKETKQKDNSTTAFAKVTKIHMLINVPYLLKNDLILLDILHNLNGRNICCQTPLYEPFDQLNKYFKEVDEHLYVY